MPGRQNRTADRRYLWQRGGRYWVQVAVPTSLQERLGKRIIQRPLGTSDINEARRLRWSHVHAVKETFKRALADENMKGDEIETIAQAEYQRIANLETLGIDGDINTALAETISQLAEELEDGESAVSMPDGEVITPDDPVISNIERETGITLSADKRRELKSALTRAQINAFDAILKRRKGQDADPVPMFNAANRATRIVSPKTDAGITVGDAISEYVRQKSPTWAVRTRSTFGTSLRLFCDHVGADKPLSDVTRLDVAQWRERMRSLHPRWASSPSSKELSLDAIIDAYGQGEETLSDKTLSRHLDAVRGMFEWATNTGHIDKANPAKAAGGKGTPRLIRSTFTDTEVAAIFKGLVPFERKPTRHTHSNALPWIAAIGAFSGARLSPICGLRASDIRQEDGVWFMDIRKDKTKAGVRKVPLHSQVIALGFLDYVKSCKSGWLFPSLGEPGKDGMRSTYIGKVFATHCRNTIPERDLLGFHMWRKTVITKLENAKVPEIETARLVGHNLKTMSYGVYSGGLDLRSLQDVVERIEYRGLNLTGGSKT